MAVNRLPMFMKIVPLKLSASKHSDCPIQIIIKGDVYGKARVDWKDGFPYSIHTRQKDTGLLSKPITRLVLEADLRVL